MTAIQQLMFYEAPPPPPPAPAPPPAPSDWTLLDTFTASDGTDPTTRDMDTYPAVTGAHRWRFDFAPTDTSTSPGAINSDRLYPTTVDVGGSSPILFVYGDGNESLFNLPIFVMLKGKADDGYVRIIAYSDGNTTAQAVLSLTEGTTGNCGGEAHSFASSSHTLAAGEHTIGFYLSTTEGALIADGSILETTTQDFSDAFPLNFIRLEAADGATAANTSVDKVAVYTGLTLTDAVALT